MTDGGKLGPLDVQILKKDELGERLSGLTLNIAMEELREQVFTTFEAFLFKIKARFRNQISLRMAMEVAAKMATDVYAEVYRQIDPLKVGEDARAMHIGEHYGELLSGEAGNVREGAIQRLLVAYPSHSCVIDREEAKELFMRLSEATKPEWDLLAQLGILATKAIDDPARELALVLSEESKPAPSNNTNTNTNTKNKADANGKSNTELTRPRSNPKSNAKERVGRGSAKESASAAPKGDGAASRNGKT